MMDLQDLYQELILDHNKRPRNRRSLDSTDYKAEGYNPLCGDKVSVFVDMQDGVVKDICFEGTGCAISTASASLMTESLKGKTKEEALAIFDRFHQLVMNGQNTDEVDPSLGKLAAFSGVGRFPARVKCATLAWHTLRAAIEGKKEEVTTE